MAASQTRHGSTARPGLGVFDDRATSGPDNSRAHWGVADAQPRASLRYQILAARSVQHEVPAMLVGYVSDERYVALEDVAVEFERGGEAVAVARSTARGRVSADVRPGSYRVTLRKDGFGRKAVAMDVVAGDPPRQFRLLSDRLTGYIWPRWVRSGERAELCFHGVEAFRLSLWRYGLKREPARILGWFDEHGPDAYMQITPDGDWTQTGVRFNRVGFGNNPHHTQEVVAPERSGLYYVEQKGQSGSFFSAPWVVAPAADGKTAAIAVLMSTNTWNAYNNFGGRSNYVNATGLPAQPIVNGRQELVRYREDGPPEWVAPDEAYLPLSFERPEPFNLVPEGASPLDPIEGRQGNHLAPAEWRLLAWLEREGFAYDVFSDAQLDDGSLDLAGYRVLIISAHPEYWTSRQFERTRTWVESGGGRLMYLGGNGLNCEVVYPTPTTMRTRSHLASTDGSLGQWNPADASHWLDSRFHRSTGQSEATLLGVATTETGIMTAAPYRVLRPDHWAFEDTGLGEGAAFGQASLHERVSGGASGHETDKMTANSPAGTVLLAKGLNPDDGGAEIVIHETPRGGAVFSVGSIVWPASLLVDSAVSAITANVLRRFLG